MRLLTLAGMELVEEEGVLRKAAGWAPAWLRSVCDTNLLSLPSSGSCCRALSPTRK